MHLLDQVANMDHHHKANNLQVANMEPHHKVNRPQAISTELLLKANKLQAVRMEHLHNHKVVAGKENFEIQKEYT